MNSKPEKLDLSDEFFSNKNQEKRLSDLTYKHTNTLKNKLNIKDRHLLKEEEDKLVKSKIIKLLDAKEITLDLVSLDTEDDKINFLKNINRYLYDDIYDFAGKFRTEDYNGSFDFIDDYVETSYLEDFAIHFDDVFKRLKKEYYEGYSSEQKKILFSVTLLDLWTINPFYKGNSATTLIFGQQFAERELNLCFDLKSFIDNDLDMLFAYANNYDAKPFLNAITKHITDPHKYDKLFNQLIPDDITTYIHKNTTIMQYYALLLDIRDSGHDISQLNLLNYELDDNPDIPTGGISYIGETVSDFLDSNNIESDISFNELNNMLDSCGIKKISISELNKSINEALKTQQKELEMEEEQEDGLEI